MRKVSHCRFFLCRDKEACANLGVYGGKCADERSSVAHVNDLEAEGEEGEERKYDRKGNCLILQVQGQWGEDDELDSYVVVLDYANKKSYVTETSVIKIHDLILRRTS